MCAIRSSISTVGARAPLSMQPIIRRDTWASVASVSCDKHPVEPLWSALLPAMQDLNRYAVKFRYPGEDATAAETKDAIKDAKAVRREARLALGLKI